MGRSIGIIGITGVMVLFAIGCAKSSDDSGADASTAGSGGNGEAGGSAGSGGDGGGGSGEGGAGGGGGDSGGGARVCDQDSECDDGQFCNGTETCGADGNCVRGEVPECDDGVDCTDDSCDNEAGACLNEPNHDNCDNDSFCDGMETCDAVSDCQPGNDPCDDGVDCTDDSCDEGDDSCENLADDDYCDNGLFCDGVETCDAESDCQTGNDPCDDGVGCTNDSCNENTDGCQNEPDDDNCDNGLFCDGEETCDAVSDCQAGVDPCDDVNPCTDDSCDEATDGCHNDANTDDCEDGNACTVGDACSDGSCIPGPPADCDDENDCTTDSCDPVLGCVSENTTDSCSDGNACTTDDTCEDGVCVGGLPPICDDSNACTSDDCDTDTGCVYTAITCDDGNPCTDDACNTDTGCTTSNNTDACTDNNPCTVGDTCLDGQCKNSSPRDCSDPNPCTDDLCDPQDNDGDPCYHLNNQDACSDGNSCTPSDACTDGECVGTGNACGVHSTGCTPDTPNQCDCESDYYDDGGFCVPDTNECNSEPCDDNADCYDPSSAGGDVECTCHSGFTGDGFKSGSGCTDIDECLGDPCGIGDGRASGCVDDIGTYDCSCNSGYMPVDDGGGQTCVCDMNGVFAIRIATDLSWSGIQNVEDGSGTTYSWAKRVQTYAADGTLTVVTTACGGTATDVCGTGNAVIDPEAYGQFTPIHIYDLPSMPEETVVMSLPLALSAEPFQTELSASLLGISLTDPLDVDGWPASRANVAGGGGSQTNGAVWVDHDADGVLGVTNYGVPPGGDANLPGGIDPPIAYGSKSLACPVYDNSNPPEIIDYLDYAWWPAPVFDPFPFFYVRRVKRFYVAARMISAFKGTIDSCDQISGDVIGPAPDGSDANTDGEFLSNARFYGCLRCYSGTAADCADYACGRPEVNFFDSQSQSDQKIDGSTFIIKRLPSDYTCAQIRAESYP